MGKDLKVGMIVRTIVQPAYEEQTPYGSQFRFSFNNEGWYHNLKGRNYGKELR